MRHQTLLNGRRVHGAVKRVLAIAATFAGSAVVDPNNSMLVYTGAANSATGSGSISLITLQGYAVIKSDGTGCTSTGGSAAGYVIEFFPGVIARVVRGTTAITGTNATATGSVSPALPGAQVFLNGLTCGFDDTAAGFASVSINAAGDTITATRGIVDVTDSSTTTVAWEVVLFM